MAQPVIVLALLLSMTSSSSASYEKSDTVVPEQGARSLRMAQTGAAQSKSMGRIVLSTMGDSEAKQAQAWIQYLFDELNTKHPDCADKIGTLLMPDHCERQIVDGEYFVCDVKTAMPQNHTFVIKFDYKPAAQRHPVEPDKAHELGLAEGKKYETVFELVSVSPNPIKDICLAKSVPTSLIAEEATRPKYHTGHINGPPREEKHFSEIFSQEDVESLPDEYDARTKCVGASALTGLNQGSCGSCYAFAAVSAMSGRIFINSNGKHNVLLSPASAAECTNGCSGGMLIMAASASVTKGGFGPRRCDPYDAAQIGNGGGTSTSKCNAGLPDNCKDGSTSLKYKLINQGTFSASYTVNGAPHTRTRQEMEQGFMTEIYNNGPVYIALGAEGSYGGIKGWDIVSGTGQVSTNHANVLWGWGVEGGVKYWIIQNSWGTQWGLNGFARVKRGTNELNMEDAGHMEYATPVLPTTCDSSSKVCLNGGTFDQSCNCKCIDNWSGDTCSICNPTCTGTNMNGQSAVVDGKCACTCNAGWHDIDTSSGMQLCGLKLQIQGQTTASVTISSGDPAYIKSQQIGCDGTSPGVLGAGDRYVLTPAWVTPWTAEDGWNSQAKFTWICSDQNSPYCCNSVNSAQTSGNQRSTFLDNQVAEGHYDIWFSKNLGNNEFGNHKGWNLAFKLNQHVVKGNPGPRPPAPTPPPNANTPPPTPPPNLPPEGSSTSEAKLKQKFRLLGVSSSSVNTVALTEQIDAAVRNVLSVANIQYTGITITIHSIVDATATILLEKEASTLLQESVQTGAGADVDYSTAIQQAGATNSQLQSVAANMDTSASGNTFCTGQTGCSGTVLQNQGSWSESSSSGSGGGGGCFSDLNSVITASGSRILVQQVEPGTVLMNSEEQDEVWWVHRVPGQHRLLRIKTQETEIDLTPHHMLWTSSRGMISANEVIMGDFINVHNHTLPATQSEVLSIEHLEGSVSAPVTMSGKIIVNGVEASCYAYASHEVVHQLVAPFRLLYKVSPSSLQALSWGILGLMDILSLAVSNTYTLELLVVSTTIILFLPIAAIQGALVAYRLRTDTKRSNS